jgi:NADH-quinone oxidoreductase subunit F
MAPEELRPLTRNFRPGAPPSLADVERAGGYRGASKALSAMSPDEVLELVKRSNLRGRGGAGFPTGAKWSFLPKGDGQRYLVANADEMEPGTFKDRVLMEGDPHQLLEGIIVAAFAIQATRAIIFIREAYVRAAELLEKAIGEAEASGWLGRSIKGSGFDLSVRVHRSAGRYICGEETSLLNALEGRRPIPRARPPYPQTAGLWGRPTVVQNVETLCNLPHIVNHGAEWFRGLARGGGQDGGTKVYGVSGRVKRPGAFELPIGTVLGEIILEHAGGMQDGLTLRGLLPGGASTSFLPADRLDAAMDFEGAKAAGSRLGTGTIVVLDDATCPVGMVENLEHFFARESCGWCTPCREGLPWLEKILHAIEEGRGEPADLELLRQQERLIGPPGRTFCALAPGAIEPLASALRLFGGDFERHLAEGRCPWRRS